MADAEQPTAADHIAVPTDKRAQLNDLITRAAAKDASKDHNAASELYSQATELQAELNGELSPENADLLYAYGKSLYNVAVSKSDVLGSKVAGEPSNAPAPKATSARSASTDGSLVKDAISSSMNQNAATPSKDVNAQLDAAPSKPFFQFTGDENFVDSDDEDEEENGGDEDENDDDFEVAFEVLDLARILYLRKLEIAEESSTDKGKGKSVDLPADVKHIKERLADTYDLQAEISLEGERFSDAVNDLRTALDLRNSLFPFEDPSVAECHYKLSLALEFASVQQQGEEDDSQEKTVDEEMRKEAATQMERAIESCKVRMASEEKKLEADKDMEEDKVVAAKRKISNVKEIIADMEQRLIDLRRSPVSIEEKEKENEAMLKGILGEIVGQSVTDQKARLDAVSKEATDLSSLVRRKPAAAQTSSQQTSSKRPADDASADGESKRARVEDA
ncbi:uncharacterized protein N7473_012902 [Penicillium subrubescens]|uniref:NASP-related protein sim3 n=1 Tax=Penicillium subrubescens TaxID=1316194 RepID=A0A1Q5T6J5_9EURO|nr:uncharacterized protein N7473_012902 [Penicillium subrubescens]KAJ5875555.1 hypothetical protein N7473_012902 [Penicillium subrubescens]OKO95860.1 NASP-related protein sim3 [Penicillium subrubescens]